MADIQLPHLGQRGHGLHGVIGQAMPGMDFKPKRMGEAGHIRQARQFRVPFRGFAFGMEIAIGAGMQFDHLRADPVRGLDLANMTIIEGDTGIISRSNTREQKMIFTVENLTGEPQALRAFFPLPYSEQEDLRVRVTASPEPDETDIERARGVSAWDMSVAPGETAEVTITVALDWPEGMDLYWYP